MTAAVRNLGPAGAPHPAPMPPESREALLDLLDRVCDRPIEVRYGAARFGIPASVFCQHIDDDALRATAAVIGRFAMWVAGNAGRLERDALVRLCFEPAHQMIDHIEDEFARIFVPDVPHQGLDVRIGGSPDDPGGVRADRVAELLADSHSEGRRRDKRSLQIRQSAARSGDRKSPSKHRRRS